MVRILFISVSGLSSCDILIILPIWWLMHCVEEQDLIYSKKKKTRPVNSAGRVTGS
jgi:hypothetical protein